MKNFDFNRYTKVVKWDFMNNWKSLLMIFLGMTVAYTCILGSPYLTIGEYYEEGLMKQVIEGASHFCFFVFSVYLTVGASRTFSPMKKKQEATALLVLPASNSEKFLSRLLMAVVVWALIGILAFVAADLLQMALAKLLGAKEVASGTVCLIDVAKNLPHFTRPLVFLSDFWIHQVLGWIVGIALYVLGSILFRRHQFWMTSISLFVIFIVIMSTFVRWIISQDFDFDIDFEKYFNYFNYGLMAIDVIIIAVCTWLSYRLFCRSQVINNKLVNI